MTDDAIRVATWDYVTIPLAARELDMPEEEIQQRIRSGEWELGHEYRQPEGPRGTTLIALDRARAWRASNPGRLQRGVAYPILRALLREARKRTKLAGRAFDIDLAHLTLLWEAQAGCCALSVVPFSVRRIGTSRRRPFVPSIDRIDSARGYERGNVRLVCVAVNYLLNEWGDEVFDTVRASLARAS